MKKISVLLSLITILGITACSDDKPAVVQKEVIIVPVVPATVPEKNTVVVFDKNGVRVGTKKVDVTINPPKKKQ